MSNLKDKQRQGVLSQTRPAENTNPGHDDLFFHEDERSPMENEDDHSGADFDAGAEVSARLDEEIPPAPASPVCLPPDADDDADDDYLEDDVPPLDCEDDHSGADFDVSVEVAAKFGHEVPPVPPRTGDTTFTPGTDAALTSDDGLHDDERSPMELEDDHSGADFDAGAEVAARFDGVAAPVAEACIPPGEGEDADYEYLEDEASPIECEDDHSGTDFDPEAEIDAALSKDTQDVPDRDNTANEGYVHPGLAAALHASMTYAEANRNASADGGDANTGSPEQAADNKHIPDIDDEVQEPLVPEDSGEEDDAVDPEELPGTATADDDEKANSSEALATVASSIAAGNSSPPSADGKDSEENDEEEEEESTDSDDKPMTLRDHLTELRKRLFRAFLWVILGFVICYPFAEELFGLLFKPLMKAMPEASKLIYTSPPEAFFTFMKVAFVGGIFATSPLVFYQLWAFIAPGLYKEEKLYIIPVAIFSALFFISGGAFCYFVVFPFAFEFFMSYNQGLIQAMPALSETLSFVLQLLLAFGLVFELPLFVFFLSRLGIVTADMMRRFRRYAILVMVIIAAILTPPDVLSQLLMAGPLMILYEASILIAVAFGKKKPKAVEEEEDDEEGEEEDEDSVEQSRSSATQ